MKKVQTVRGPVDADQLGRTLMHEHFLFGYPGWHGDLTLGGFDQEACICRGVTMAESLLARGVRTIVDPTPNETGRDPVILKDISDRTGMNIICSTGYYYERGSATAYFKSRRVLGKLDQEIYEMMKAEVATGIGKAGVRAGVIKVASSRDEITKYEQVFFRAAARVSAECNVSIITHTQEGKQGPEQAKLLIENGADPKRIMIGHMCGSTDMDYFLRTLEQGVYIGFDRFGIEGQVGAPFDSRRIACMIGLIGVGYIERIMLSHDWVNYWLGRPGMEGLSIKNVPTHLFDHIIPELAKAGLGWSQVETLLDRNPREFLAGS